MRSVWHFINNLQNSRKLGIALLLVVVGFGLLQPVFHNASPAKQNLRYVLQPPSWQEPLGTDHLGRSMFARIGEAIRISLGMSLVSLLFSTIPGVALGVVAGWKGGWIDRRLSLLADAISALPGLLLILLVAALAQGSFFILSIAVAMVIWLDYFRVVRAQTKTIVSSPQIQASKVLGFSNWYCFRRHVWPSLAPNVFVLAAFGAGQAILVLATLGFISVGLRPPLAELGYMMTELFPHYYEAPLIFFQPVTVVFLLVWSLNLLAGSQIE